jgi:hypothetical protein
MRAGMSSLATETNGLLLADSNDSARRVLDDQRGYSPDRVLTDQALGRPTEGRLHNRIKLRPGPGSGPPDAASTRIRHGGERGDQRPGPEAGRGAVPVLRPGPRAPADHAVRAGQGAGPSSARSCTSTRES